MRRVRIERAATLFVASALVSFPAAAQWNAYDQAESQLTDAYRSLMMDLPPSERLNLRSAERTWIASRNRLCGHDARNACATKQSSERARNLDRIWVARFMPHVGQCFATAVAKVGPRLEGDTNTHDGASISYKDGHDQVDYESSPRSLGFRPRDPVRLCVIALPTNCPPGDHRGIIYKATDLASRRTWSAPDSEHGCGGA